MKLCRPHRLLATALATACISFVGCSGSKQDEEQMDTQASQSVDDGEEAADDSEAKNNYANNGGNQSGNAGAEMNNATEEEESGGEVANAGLNGNTGAENPALNPSMNAPANNPNSMLVNAPSNAATDMGEIPPPVNQTAVPPPMNAVAPTNAVAAAPAAPATPESPVAGGRVRYVKKGGVQVMNAPNGSPVRTLEQGEHPLTWEENGWLRINNGMYVPKDSLSDKGVPRPRRHHWSH